MEDVLEGGCWCGAIRYRITGEPVMQLFCFCADCRSFSGTDAFAGYMVRAEDFEHVAGEPVLHEKRSREGRRVVRRFCGTCGSNLWGETEFGIVGVSAGSLDEPERFSPSTSVFTEDAPHWARVPTLDDPGS